MQFLRGSSSQRNSHEGESSNWQQRRLESKDLPSVRRLGEGLSGFLYETTWNGSKYVRKDFPLGSVHHNVFEKEAIALLDLEHPNIVICSHYTVGKSSCSLLLQYVDDDLQNFIQKRIDVQGKGNRIGSSTDLHSRALNIDETRILISSKAKVRETAGADVGLTKVPENEFTVPLALPDALKIILQIATGVEYLHDNGIAHGDLKPKNVLVGYGGIVKLVDFGLLETKKRIKLVSKHRRHFEILIWKAPELFTKLLGPVSEDSDDPFTDSDTDETEEVESSVTFAKSRLAMADVYSFGLICSQILGGKLVYPNLSLNQLREQRMHGFRPQLPSTCPNDLQFLIFSSVQRDPWCRPTFTDICTTLKDFQSNWRPLLMEGAESVETDGTRSSENRESFTEIHEELDTLKAQFDFESFSKLGQVKHFESSFGVERTNPLSEDADQSLTEIPRDVGQIKNLKNTTGMDMENATLVVLEKSGLLDLRDELHSNLKIDPTAIKIEEPVRSVVLNSKGDEANEVFSGTPKNSSVSYSTPEVNQLKKLEAKVKMCCPKCEGIVKETVFKMRGVFALKTDRLNSLVTILEFPGGGLDHEKLLRGLRKVNRKAKFVEFSTTTVAAPNPPFEPKHMVPEPASSDASSDSPFIRNPVYLHYQVSCDKCLGYPSVVCARCGRRSDQCPSYFSSTLTSYSDTVSSKEAGSRFNDNMYLCPPL